MRIRAPLVAVVLAGGGPEDGLARAVGAPCKALVPFGDRPLVDVVIAALRASGAVERIVLVGNLGGRSGGLHDVAVPAGERLVDSLALGLGAALGQPGAPEEVLVVTADVPWLTGEAVARFVNAARSLEGEGGAPAQLVYPVVEEGDARAQYPEQRRTYARLADGKFTGGNLVLLRRAVVPALLPLLDRAYRHRKNPFGLARLVGVTTLVDLALGRARIAKLERRVSALLKAPARALPTPDACLAADVDEASQLPAVGTAGLPDAPRRNP